MKLLLVPLILIIFFPVYLFGAWVWMVCLGALSHIFEQPNWAISYWESVLVAFIFSVLLGGLGASKD